MKEVQLVIKNNCKNKYLNGYPLVEEEAIEEHLKMQEGQVFVLKDTKGEFIARAYYGVQNKGIGWILTTNKREKINQEYFDNKIKMAYVARKKLRDDPETTAYRIFNGEGDGIGGLTIDYFEGYYLVTWYSKGIYKFREEILNAINKRYDLIGIYEKKRFNTHGTFIEDDGYVSGVKPEFPIIVKESGVNFAIYLNDGAMVGVFLDQRDVRRTLRDKYSKGKTILNTFSYTGAFSVFAALGGATNTTSVDLANRSLPKTIEQFEINNINADEQSIIVDDVFDYFKYAVRKDVKYDVVVLDPPAFAKSKKVDFSASRDYTGLIEHAIDLSNDDGLIIASTNCATFNMGKFKTFIKTAFENKECKYKLLEEFSLPKDFAVNKDFKEGNYLKVVFIRKI